MLTFLEKYKFELAALFLTAAALLINPYYFGISDHTYKIPFIQAALDPSVYPGDITVAMHRFYVSLFYLPVWPLTKIFGFQNAFLLAYVFSCALFFAMVYKISGKISGVRFLGVLSMMALFSAKNAGGGIATIDFIVEERFTASAILLFSVYLLISARPVLSGIFFGLAANIHLVSAVNFLLFILIFSLACIVRPYDSKRKFGREFFSFCLLAGLASLPVLIKKIMEGGGGLTVFIDPEWMRMIMLRSSHHFSADYSFLFSRLAFGGLSLFILVRLGVLKSQPLFLYAFASSAAALTLGFGLAVIFSGMFPSLLGFCLSFYRAGYFFVVLMYIASSFIFLSFFPKNVFSACAAVVVFSWMGMRFQLVLLAGLSAALFFLPAFQKKYFKPLLPVLSGKQLALLVFTFVLLSGAGKYSQPVFISPAPALKAAQLWLRENTVKEALILMPPYEDDFRVFSGRPTAGSWKDWTYNVLQREFAFEMQNRLKDFCGISADVCKGQRPCLDLCVQNYAKLTEAQMAALTEKYGIDFIVRDRKTPLNLEKVYANEKYFIYKAPA